MKRLLGYWLRLASLLLMGALGSAVAQANPTPMVLTPDEQAWISQHPVLHVGVFDNLIPFEYLGGDQLRGLSAKYLSLISQRTGLHFKFVPTTTRMARKDMLLQGEVDILSTRRRSNDPAEDAGVLYTAPYNTSSNIVVTRVGGHEVADVRQMAGKTLVMLGREGYAAILSKLAPGAKLVAAENAVDMLAMVRDGRADAAVASEWLLIPYLSRQYRGVLQISGGVVQMQPGISMAVRDDQVMLLAILQKALASIGVDERKAIYDSWFADMELDIPSVQSIAEHFQGELWMLLIVVLLLLVLVYQSRQQRRRAMRNEREKAMFLAVMSHEIRSPMNAVLAAVELLEHTPLDEQQRHFTELANSGANTLLRLLDDVLDISKMEAGQLKLNLEPVDLLALVQGVVDLHQLRAEEKGLAISITGEHSIAPLLLDETRLAQVLRNLLSNAITFTEAGGVHIQLELQGPGGPAVDHQQLRVRVVDSGIGMSEQALAALERPYAQAQHAYQRTSGSGLGLVICRELVKLMHGTLSLRSTLGVGTVVELWLPVEQALALEAPVPAEVAQVVAAATDVASPGLRILVVEDTLANQHVLRAQLQSLGCEALLADDGAMGLALFAEHRVNLVLMDCDLPDCDGYSLARKFRGLEQEQQWAHCPIIAISALTGNEHLERCFDAGMDGVLSKPIRLAKLQDMLELWCDVTLVPRAQPLTPQTLELSAVHEEVRKDLANLIEAIALRDPQRALYAVHRLHGAALILDWADMAAPAAILEHLLRDHVEWSGAYVHNLRALVEHWYTVLDATPSA